MVTATMLLWGLASGWIAPGFRVAAPVVTRVNVAIKPLESPKLSPHAIEGKKLEFSYLTEGLVELEKAPSLRFRVFSQDLETHQNLSGPITELLLKCWRFAYEEWIIDHRLDYKRTVDIYLCQQGLAGGEQRFGDDLQSPRGVSTKVNAIYIYDLPSFVDPTERVREVVHEYGHAILPAIGGYQQPEYWANGFLGERMFSMRLLQDLENETNATSSASTEPNWMLGGNRSDLRKWVNANCNPLMITSSTLNPYNALKGDSEMSMNRYIGLMLWMQQCFRPKIVGRMMKFQSETDPLKVPNAIRDAVEGAGDYRITIPEVLKGRLIWLPLSGFKLEGAKIVARQGGWVQVTSNSGEIFAHQEF